MRWQGVIAAGVESMKERKKNSRVRRSGLGFEQLEGRRMLSANPWHNPQLAADVNGDGNVVAADALQVINELNSGGARPLAIAEGETTVQGPAFLDVDNDSNLSPSDALQVISEINGEGPLASDGRVNLLGDDDIVDPACLDVLLSDDVLKLLDRASAATPSTDAIIAVVDRGGKILGVRTESGALFTGDPGTRVFAIDGAVAKARTAAFFAHNMAPLTSRTIRNISQSTITQREVESNPNSTDGFLQGPGTVAPIGLGAHFPPAIMHTPPVDLFDIEHTNRDSLLHPGLDGRRGTADDILLDYRFNIDPVNVPAGQEIEPPESYGGQSGLMPTAQSRGIGTLPGGIPLYKNSCHVGGIGVFFPGPDGFASHEQGFSGVYPHAGAEPLGANGSTAAALRAEYFRTNSDKALEAEWIAFAAAGGSPGAGVAVGDLAGVPLPPGIVGLPFGRIDLVGIRLEVFGPNPTTSDTRSGVERLLEDYASDSGLVNGVNGQVDPSDPLGTPLSGTTVPAGWLVTPQPSQSGDLSAQDVQDIIQAGIDEANLVRAAIRLDANGKPGPRSRMVFAVADLDGTVLGLYRMQDATYFSIAVAVAKARNMTYYSGGAVAALDQVSYDGVGPQQGLALTNRTFRFLAEPRFPDGVDGTPAAIFSILNHSEISLTTAENDGPIDAASFSSGVKGDDNVLGFTRFLPERNFHAPDADFPIQNQNGVVFFPGAGPLYDDDGTTLVGGLGVSGDGVDQDDVVTSMASEEYAPLSPLRVDAFFVGGVRLPYQKFLRNPHG